MLKFFYFFILFFSTSFAAEIKIEATVNERVITSFDLKVRMEISKIINPQSFQQNTPEVIKASILERLIQEKLLFKAASESGFSIPISELESSVKIIISENPNLKGKNVKALFGEAGYKSFVEQTRGEIIFNAILSSYANGKTDFSKEEINKFTKSYNSENPKKITEEEGRRILTSMKLNEIQQNMMKTLSENSVIEIKQ